jgi:AraC family transcriptional regulator
MRNTGTGFVERSTLSMRILAAATTVAEIAAAALFSVFQFQRLFRAIVGESVAEFTRRIRLETAARRLVFWPQEDITSLAMELGFSSSQNFAKAFKSHFRISPTQYREQHDGSAQGSDEDLGPSLFDPVLLVSVTGIMPIEYKVVVRQRP